MPELCAAAASKFSCLVCGVPHRLAGGGRCGKCVLFEMWQKVAEVVSQVILEHEDEDYSDACYKLLQRLCISHPPPDTHSSPVASLGRLKKKK